MTRRPTPQLQPGQTRLQQIEQLQAEVEHLRTYIESLDGKHIGIRADNCFIDDGIVVASDILEPRTMTQRETFEMIHTRAARLEAEIERLTAERDALKSEASELATDLKRAMGESERLRARIRGFAGHFVTLEDARDALNGAEQIAGK